MMTIAPIPGTPFWNWEGNYTPPQAAQLSSLDYLSSPASGDAVAIAKNYLQTNSARYGLTAADLSRATVTNAYTDTATGVRNVYFQQTFNGLPVADAHANVSMTSDGRVIAANTSFVRGLSYPPTNTTPTPTISAQSALEVFAAAAYLTTDGLSTVDNTIGGSSQQTTISDSDISAKPIIARLQYQPTPTGGVDLGWQLIVQEPKTATPHWFDVAIGASGARTSQVTRVNDWVSNATYNVYAQPIQDPLFGSQSTVTDPQNTLASPNGWHDLNFLPGSETTNTTGNNVSAQTPAPLSQTAQSNPTGSLNFPYAYDTAQEPTVQQNQDAALTNLFYWVNLAHDISYQYGFDEAAGNFQFANRTSTGVAGDGVMAFDQGTFAGVPVLNNAFFATPPDGQSGVMTMGVSTLGGTPLRSLSFDNGTIMHEYMHGISTRLTGGPANSNALNNLQSGGMGEGWGDWFELITTMKPGDTAATARPSSLWFAGQQLGGPGIRRFPYSFDMSINPLTLGDFNGDTFPQENNSEVHNAGEIWTSALWDMTWLLINKYGQSTDLYNGNGGNNVAMELVFQGMKLQPVNPTFLQARDAIISADFTLNGGANYELIWQAFARRGFGLSSTTPNSNSTIVFEAFDMPQPLGRVRGNVFNDIDGDAKRDGNERGLLGITIYHDANQNSRFDSGERSVVTAADGSYDIAFQTSQLVYLRQSLSSDYKQTLPAKNNARAVFVTSGQTVSGADFGNQASPGKISGIKFNDLNANGTFDTGEPYISNTVIFVDLNNDGKLSIAEPSAMTDNYGRYMITGVQPGTDYVLREIMNPGVVQTSPGALATVPFAYSGITVLPNLTVSGMNFANTTSEDFGDAPNTYGTLRASNGARHGFLPGFHLGPSIDVEPDGQPTADASGDDGNPIPPDPLPVPPPPSPDDDDGVSFIDGGISPGATSRVQITVNSGTNSAGRIQGWIDFNQNGKFDSNEKIISNVLQGTGTRTLSFQVPATAKQGTTFARFRYGYEMDMGPTGASIAGEVEDYIVTVLPNVPVANPDVFPLAGGQLIRTDAFEYALDVLANDPTTIFGAPQIVVGSFPTTLPGTGSTLKLNTTGNRILYTAGPNVEAGQQETFTYQVTDGNSISAPGTVIINVSLSNPIAFDDTYTLTAVAGQPTTAQLAVMLNDLFPQADTVIVSDPVFVPQDPLNDIQDTTLTVNGLDATKLDFNAPTGFRGTEVFRYTINDTDSSTAAASALVTIQVIDAAATDEQLRAAGYQAIIGVVFLDEAGNPVDNLQVDQGDIFSVQVTARDIRAGGTDENRGVEGPFLDLLFDRNKVEPILTTANPAGFDITFEPFYRNVFSSSPAFNNPNVPGDGQIDELGSLWQSDGSPPPAPGQAELAVYTIRLRAIAPTLLGETVQIFADPAEEENVLVTSEFYPNPANGPQEAVPLADNQVLYRPSGSLTIFGAGEGLFVNRSNPLDVTRDGQVAPNDVLAVINTLNAGGSRSLRNGGTSPTTISGMVDVNMDSSLSPIDALTVVNFLNSRSHLRFAGGGSGGEGEGSSVSSSAASSSDVDASLMGLLSLDQGTATSAATPATNAAVLPQTNSTASSTSSATSSLTSMSSTTTASTTTVNTAAVDDVFAEMATARTTLKQKYKR